MSFRYVVLFHEGHGEPHFDLMFESSAGSELLTWRSSDWPLHDGSILTPLGAHRRAYLGYEGPVTGGRGTVRRVHAGSFELLANSREEFSGEFEDGRRFSFHKRDDGTWLAELNQRPLPRDQRQ